ncbi:MAG: ABC transporter permease [Eubacteriales bacterium]
MKLTQAVKMAFSAILSNKMRSFLTMLGIIIGVLSVTLLVGIVQGATDSVTAQLQGLGGNKLMVSITSPKATYITLEDLANLQNKDGLGLIAPAIQGKDTAKSDGKISSASISGVTDTAQTVDGITVVNGRFIQQSDNQNRLNVAVVGAKIAKDLFGHTDVVGSSFTMLGRSFEIIGVLKEDGTTSMSSQDSTVYIPINTASRLMNQTSIRSFNAATISSSTVNQGKTALENFLGSKIKASSDNSEDKGYTIFNMGDILSAFDSIMGTMSLLLGGIASISLIVGGIGIMNIMLVSVTERTREIGIRKAIGAQHSDILIQFLIEAVSISITGGLIGMLMGAGLLQVLSGIMDLQLHLSVSVSALALGFSLAIGVIFGIYPANKAAMLKPIDALRYE